MRFMALILSVGFVFACNSQIIVTDARMEGNRYPHYKGTFLEVDGKKYALPFVKATSIFLDDSAKFEEIVLYDSKGNQLQLIVKNARSRHPKVYFGIDSPEDVSRNSMIGKREEWYLLEGLKKQAEYHMRVEENKICAEKFGIENCDKCLPPSPPFNPNCHYY